MVLGIETSDLLCSVACVNNDRILVEYNHELPRQHASLVGNLVENAGRFLVANKLSAQNFMDDLELVAVSIGPGSFTGLRIGLSYAQGLCLSKNIPLVGVSNHQVLAEYCPDSYDDVCTIIEARQDEVYLANMIRNKTYFEMNDQRIVGKINLVSAINDNAILIYGSGMQLDNSTKKELIGKKINIISSVRYSAALTARIGWQKFHDVGADSLTDLEPLYIRPFAGVQ